MTVMLADKIYSLMHKILLRSFDVKVRNAAIYTTFIMKCYIFVLISKDFKILNIMINLIRNI